MKKSYIIFWFIFAKKNKILNSSIIPKIFYIFAPRKVLRKNVIRIKPQ